jgi:hypothetical protein
MNEQASERQNDLELAPTQASSLEVSILYFHEIEIPRTHFWPVMAFHIRRIASKVVPWRSEKPRQPPEAYEKEEVAKTLQEFRDTWTRKFVMDLSTPAGEWEELGCDEIEEDLSVQPRLSFRAAALALTATVRLRKAAWAGRY